MTALLSVAALGLPIAGKSKVVPLHDGWERLPADLQPVGAYAQQAETDAKEAAINSELVEVKIHEVHHYRS